MTISYKRLWKILIDKDLKKKDLPKIANISSYTVGRITNGENVTTDTLLKICVALDCTFDDIMEIVDDEKCVEDRQNGR